MAEHVLTADYFIAPDADGEPTLWRGKPDDLAPIAVLSQHDLRDDSPVWAFLVANVRSAPVDECEDDEEPEPCAAEIRAGSYFEPPEFCDEDALPGSEFCHAHDPDAREDYLVERAQSLREDLIYGRD